MGLNDNINGRGNNMKFRFFVVAVFLLLGVLLMNSGLAYADELSGLPGSINALNSGYAITRWPPSDGIFLQFADLTVKALTTKYPNDPNATHVVFRWNLPNGSSFDTDPYPLENIGNTWKTNPVYEANDTQTLSLLGDYGVQALFHNGTDDLQGPEHPYEIVKIKAISGHAIPEVPFGTIATILGMLATLSVFAIKKKVFVPKR